MFGSILVAAALTANFNETTVPVSFRDGVLRLAKPNAESAACVVTFERDEYPSK